MAAAMDCLFQKLTSLCMLFEVVTINLHYMTDRQEQFDLKYNT